MTIYDPEWELPTNLRGRMYTGAELRRNDLCALADAFHYGVPPVDVPPSPVDRLEDLEV